MSKCICNDCEIQIEWKKGEWLDPSNKCIRRTDGKKVRIYWCGCPKHNGKTNRRTPDNKTLIEQADKLKNPETK